MHREDFPGVAIRIRKPELILTSKTTGGIFLYPLQDALCLETFFPGGNFFDGLDFDPRMIDRTQPPGPEDTERSLRPVESNRISRNPVSASNI